MQRLGETRDAIIEDNNKLIENIINANQNLQEKYWIVLFAKATKCHVEGKPAIAQHIKPYKTKPKSQVGQIVAEVNNKLGTVIWEINMPDIPFDFDAVPNAVYIPGGKIITETTTIGKSYIT